MKSSHADSGQVSVSADLVSVSADLVSVSADLPRAYDRGGLTDSPTCECGAPELTVDHITYACPLYKPPISETGLVKLDDATRKWLPSAQL